MAGGAEKCRRLKSEMHYDQVIDYKNEDIDEALPIIFRDGIDLYFDNVGGSLLDNVLGRLRRRARIVICGAISEYLLDPQDRHRFVNLQNLGRQDAKMEGFFVFDYEEHYSEYIETLSNWVRTRALDPIEHISYGIDTLPDALSDLYIGNNVGVRIVEVGRPDLAL